MLYLFTKRSWDRSLNGDKVNEFWSGRKLDSSFIYEKKVSYERDDTQHTHKLILQLMFNQ